ncbi:MAG: hypothetical protein D6711_14190 [Chloroflexi bacterium]|nr:MAG: hypothetical protein D6711_14190 [Chloroflexota bacterium]
MEDNRLKIRITAQAVMAFGLVFSRGDVLVENAGNKPLLMQLVKQGDAVIVSGGTENKKTEQVTENKTESLEAKIKKPKTSSQLSRPGEASHKKTVKRRTKKQEP